MLGKRRRSAASSAAGPSSKRSTGEPRRWVFEDMGDIPAPIRAKKVQRCFVEFRDIDHAAVKPDALDGIPDEKRSNHCVMRLEFKHAQGSARGVVIDLAFSGNSRLKSSDAKLYVRKATWDGPHATTMKSLEIPIRKGRGRNNRDKMIKDFLQVIVDEDLIPCSYNTETEKANGCRDFNSQYVYRLNEANVVKVADNARGQIYDTFNYCYGPVMDRAMPRPVSYACFSDTYHAKHHAITEIHYAGNRMSRDSDAAKERARGGSQFP